MLNMVDNKIMYNADTKARFDAILCKLDCGCNHSREEHGFDTLTVFYTMPNGQHYIYTEDLYGTPVSIERMR